jgi:prophage DNA circulation protein
MTRLRSAEYRSPKGAVFKFEYEDVSEQITRKTAVFDFPEADVTYVQDLGKTGRRYPMRIIFWGPLSADISNLFLSALEQRGIGRLTHPVYGELDVIPVDVVTRSDRVKTASNQVVFDVTFFETIREIYPLSQTDENFDAREAFDQMNIDLADIFAANENLKQAASLASAKTNILSQLKNTAARVKNVVNQVQDVARKFNRIVKDIQSSIDSAILTPAALALQITQAISAPASAVNAIRDTIESFDNLVNDITSQSNSDGNFFVRDLYAVSYVGATCLSVLNAQFVTKNEAIDAASTVLDIFDKIVEWREENFIEPDTGEVYQQLQTLAAITTGFLIQLSFSLKQARTIVLNRDRTLIDLSAELFGDIDDRLDFLITSNQLSGSEILTLPTGKKLDYYV